MKFTLDEILEEIQNKTDGEHTRTLDLKLGIQVSKKNISLTNLQTISTKVNRDIIHIIAFFKKELAIKLDYNKSKKVLVFRGKYNKLFLEDILNKYLKNYVFCKNCMKFDTNLQIIDSKEKIFCNACNFTSNIL